MDNLIQYGYIGLFLGSFLAATILPLGSEIIFISLLASGFDKGMCLIIASIGNTLGGMTNYALGSLGKIEWIEKYLHIPSQKILSIKARLQGRSSAVAFFSFLPIIGDPLAITLGFMQANKAITTISMFLGKFMRYGILTLPFLS